MPASATPFATLCCSGASPTALFRGRTAAELAESEGFPATANLIRLTQERPPAGSGGSSGEADSRSTDASRASAQQQQQQLQQQQQRAAQAARLAEVRKQLSAVDADYQRGSAGPDPARASSDPCELRLQPERSAGLAVTGSAPAPAPASWQAQLAALQHASPSGAGAGTGAQLRPGSPAAEAVPARQLASQLSRERREAARVALAEQQAAGHEARQQQRQEAEQRRLADSRERRAELERQLKPGAQPAPDASQLEAELAALMAGSEPAGPGPAQQSGRSGGSASQPGTPETQAVFAAKSGVEAATAAAAAEAALTGSGGHHLPRHPPSLPRIDSKGEMDEGLGQLAGAGSGSGELSGGEADPTHSGGSASNGGGSSAASSLHNDPLLEFVRRAMLSRVDGGAGGPPASPFANTNGLQLPSQPTLVAQSPLHAGPGRGPSSGTLPSPAPSGQSSGGYGTGFTRTDTGRNTGATTLSQRGSSLVDIK